MDVKMESNQTQDEMSTNPLCQEALQLGEIVKGPAAAERASIVCCRACPWTPRVFSCLVVGAATKPLHPPLQGQFWYSSHAALLQLPGWHRVASSGSYASFSRSSPRTVSSTMQAAFSVGGQSITSGLRLVCQHLPVVGSASFDWLDWWLRKIYRSVRGPCFDSFKPLFLLS